MHVQVITGNAGTGKTTKLRSIEAQQLAEGRQAGIIHADAYSHHGLLGIMEVRLERGERTLLVDDCSSKQIEEVLQWQKEAEGNEQFKGLAIHLVRRAG
ncbi:hypothetical protein HU724_019215 [Pseudomonas iranensis]|uniref:hypothetical protein n=1 Tax=Pseudomonas iranensis TaxID=2745503 RepID=UPI0016460F67|nr:hypothetical protein [Pseudomonas iranensis]QXI21142.1 hypothetical protein HU724_019215 [Pseudomonas iranensis]